MVDLIREKQGDFHEGDKVSSRMSLCVLGEVDRESIKINFTLFHIVFTLSQSLNHDLTGESIHGFEWL